MTTKSDLRIHNPEWCHHADVDGCSHAFVADLVAALIAEGGETINALTRQRIPYPFKEPGRYLVFPIPVESAEAKETPR